MDNIPFGMIPWKIISHFVPNLLAPDAVADRGAWRFPMLTISNVLIKRYADYIKSCEVPSANLAEYIKWLRYFLDFCDKYPVPADKGRQIRSFCDKLQEKKQSDARRERAAHAVSLYFKLISQSGKDTTNPSPAPEVTTSAQPDATNDVSVSPPSELPGWKEAPPHPQPYYVSEEPPRYAVIQSRRSQYNEAGYQATSKSPEWDAVVETMPAEIKVRHYSRKTLQTYAKWTRNFQYFLKNKPPAILGTDDVKDYLTFLAVKCKVAASIQNQAFNEAGGRLMAEG